MAIAIVINTLTNKAVYRRHETFISDVRLPAMSLGLRLCASRKGGTGRGGQVSALSLGSMAASGLGLDKLLLAPLPKVAWPLLGLALINSCLELGWPFLSSFAQKSRENNPPAL